MTLRLTYKKIGGTTVMNARNGKGGTQNNYKPKQNRMLENYVCNDRTRNDEAANILLSLNRKNTLDNSCNDKEKNNSEGGNKGDKNDQFEANINMSANEFGKGNVCLAEECGVDDCEGQLEQIKKPQQILMIMNAT